MEHATAGRQPPLHVHPRDVSINAALAALADPGPVVDRA